MTLSLSGLEVESSSMLKRTDSDPVEHLLGHLNTRYSQNITGHLSQPERGAQYAALPEDLDERLRFALSCRGLTQLYSHQRESWDALARGTHLVIATPTASGKSLCFNLPVLDAALKNGAKALYLFPTKALAQDQVAELLELNQAGQLGVRAYTFDGDTPSDARQAVRTKGDVVVTNPDMLHQAVLPHHSKWAQFFRALKFVVIDEVHTYRGVFGSHVANVLRRLHRILAFYQAEPQFILCSATIGNALEHAEKLTGLPMQLVDRSGAPAGAKHLLFWNPPVVNAELGIRASARSQSTRIARLAIKSGLKTIVFAQSRLMVEIITKYLKDVFDRDPRKPARIRAYRGGYLPNERRSTERELRAGAVDGVVSTSALELGVDIGALDVCVLNGYPGSIAATWQRLGRAGRRSRSALGVLVASSEALDQYLVRNPEFFLGAAPENARIAPDQLLILFDHLRCAAYELPFMDQEQFGGSERGEFMELLAEDGVIHRDGGRWHWIADSYPAQAVNLRAVADGNFVVVDRTGGKQVVIAEVDYSAAALTLYEGAIYLTQTVPYQVEQLDWAGRKAYVTRTHVDYYTDAIDYTKLRTLAEFASTPSQRGSVSHGEAHVARRVPGYKKIRYYSHENIGYGPINLPDHDLQTTAIWWQLPARTLDQCFSSRWQALDGFLGAAYALHTVSVLRAMAEPHDLGKAVGNADATWAATASASGRGELRSAEGQRLEPSELTSFSPALYLYDNYPGGMGLSEPLFLDSALLLRAALKLVHACNCHHGCPACIGPILQSEANAERTQKAAAIKILELLMPNVESEQVLLEQAEPVGRHLPGPSA